MWRTGPAYRLGADQDAATSGGRRPRGGLWPPDERLCGAVETVARLPAEAAVWVGPDDLLQPYPVGAVEGERGAGVQHLGGRAVDDDGVDRVWRGLA